MKSHGAKPILLSGIQPSGQLMIGNYVGAIQNWLTLQHTHECIFMLVDLHAITVNQDPRQLQKRSYEFLALYLACGLSSANNTIFMQSHIPGHTQLAWILTCITPMGELNRMTQFKDKAQRHPKQVNTGLFAYPILMAADILLYGADLIPVGEDQKQHLELTRSLAQRFNKRFGPVFTVPKPFMPQVGARIMSLQDPTTKMSKSDDNAASYIALLDPPDIVRRKIQRAVTDSGRDIVFSQIKPGISNLMTIFSALTGTTMPAIEERFQGKGYAAFKAQLAEAIIDFLKPIQARFDHYISDADYLKAVLQKGAGEANAKAEQMLKTVHAAVGFIPLQKGD